MKLRRGTWWWIGIMLFLLLGIAACATTGGGGPAVSLHAQYALGVQRVLVLGVSFPGIEPERTIQQIKNHVLDKSIDYYAKQSYGKITIVGEVKGWYRLPRPLEDYKVSPYNINVDPARVRRLVEDSLSAAEKDVSFSQYNHIILVVGVKTTPGVGYGMIAYCANPGLLRAGLMRRGGAKMEIITTRGGQSYDRGIIVVAYNAHTGHIVHDFAHSMGGVVGGKRPMPDLYDTVLQGKVGTLTHETYPKFTQFMGPWDVMSRHFIEWEGPPPGMCSFTRLRMGWIADNQVVEVNPGESRALTLAPLGNGQGNLVIKIPGRWGAYYLLENRQITPSDPVLPATGLLVLQIDEAKEDGDGIVQVVNANPGVPDFGAAAYGLGAGQSPSANLVRDVAVEILWQQEKNLVVMVTTSAQAAEVRALAQRIRELDSKWSASPSSPAAAKTRANLAAAKELLLQMKVSEAKAKVENIR